MAAQVDRQAKTKRSGSGHSSNYDAVGDAIVTITCASCKVTVQESPNRRRTLCPHCGNFLSEDVEREARMASRTQKSRPRVPTGKSSRQSSLSNSTSLPRISHHEDKAKVTRTASKQSEQQTGPIQAIRSFFKKLGPSNEQQARNVTKARQPPARLPPLTKSISSNIASESKSPIVKVAEKQISPTQLNAYLVDAKSSNNWGKLTDFFQQTFSSAIEINAVFKDFEKEKDSKLSVSDACIKQELLNEAYRILEECPKEVHSAMFRSIIDLLVDNNKLLPSGGQASRDDVRALLIVLVNPLFKEPSHSIVFAHLLRQVASVTHLQHCLVVWLRNMNKDVFLGITKTINAFVTRRLFGDSTLPSHVLPPADKCAWWIPNAVRVLAIFNAANNVPSGSVVPYSEFYNSSLELLDLGSQYKTWLNSSGEKNRFSFCQYPFIMTLAAKRAILEADSEHQMVLNAQRSLIMDVVGGEKVGLETFFLNLHIRRAFLLDDSIDELSNKSSDLKKKLRVTFVGEPGLDVGGLTKEWFLLLMEKIFSPDYGMFTYNKQAGMFWLSPALQENFQEFHLVGVLMGLAVYNGIILDLRFPPVLYRKLLSPAVCPFDNPNATVGVCQTGLSDLKAVFPEITQGLQELLQYEGSVEEDFYLTFQISTTELGEVKTSELKRGGAKIPVTNSNREEYVNLYVDWLLNRSVYKHFRAFYFGFHSVCASNAILLFRPEEIESLVCGTPIVDVEKLRRVTEYENGFSRESATIQDFWEIVNEMPESQLTKLLFFITSCTRMPIGCDLTIKIVRADNLSMLPMAQTCFNRLFLPDYQDKELLAERLAIALDNSQGFGIE